MSNTQVTPEQIERARNTNLAEYFKNSGYECELKRNELHVKGFGGLFVNVNTNQWYCFSNSSKNGGNNALNCLTDIIGMDFKTAVTELAGDTATRTYSTEYKRQNVSVPAQKRELELPKKDDNYRKIFAYLCQTRKLDKEIVSELVRDGLLYQSKTAVKDKSGNNVLDEKGNPKFVHNAVFVHKDESGKIVGAEIQGTNTFQRYKGVAAGTTDSVFAVKIGEPTKVYVFESAIDLMSFKQLANQEKIKNSLLVSMAGLKLNSIKQFAEKGMKMYSCVDNDEAGIKFTSENNLQSCRKILEQNSLKDWNELLLKSAAKGIENPTEKTGKCNKHNRH